jgi:PhzF family phenazine biosynthesis protein
MHPVRLLQIDAFTAEPFRGNPAGVCLLRESAAEEWMQAVAAEMNLSETAFLVPRAPREFGIRWFTPTTEVPLCGHATLASAHALWTEGVVADTHAITFHAGSGRLAARRERDWIVLDFPTLVAREMSAPAGLAAALGSRPLGVYRNEHSIWLMELDTAATVRALSPDFAGLQRAGVGACIVTAAGDPGACDFVSRFFAPGHGIDEDPVTGSAHCSLAPFWAERLGRPELVGHQVSRRGGVVKVRVKGERVEILGQARTVFEGSLQVAPVPGAV